MEITHWFNLTRNYLIERAKFIKIRKKGSQIKQCRTEAKSNTCTQISFHPNGYFRIRLSFSMLELFIFVFMYIFLAFDDIETLVAKHNAPPQEQTAATASAAKQMTLFHRRIQSAGGKLHKSTVSQENSILILESSSLHTFFLIQFRCAYVHCTQACLIWWKRMEWN